MNFMISGGTVKNLNISTSQPFSSTSTDLSTILLKTRKVLADYQSRESALKNLVVRQQEEIDALRRALMKY